MDSERVARVSLDASALVGQVWDECADAFFPVLGYLCGLKSESRVPVIVGLEGRDVSRDDLKAFSAAFGTTASVAIFHMAGITPEAPDVPTALGHLLPEESIELTQLEFAAAWRALDSGWQPGLMMGEDKIQLVAVGNPHLSLTECAKLAQLSIASAPVHPSVSFVATMGRDVFQQAVAAGYVSTLQSYGVQFVTDTCWCMLQEPVVPPASQALITNSAKFAHYAPGLVNRRVRFHTMAGCIHAASSARAPAPPTWLAHVKQHRGFAASVARPSLTLLRPWALAMPIAILRNYCRTVHFF